MHFTVDDISHTGANLQRPECVLAHRSGTLLVPDWSGPGGISVIHPDGRCRRILQKNPTFDLKPNGIALEPDGACLLAHLGDSHGGVYRLSADGGLTAEVLTANGRPLPPTNYVVRDRQNRLWITVSTRVMPRTDDFRASACSGFIALAEPGARDARIVADNLGYSNECVVDEEHGFLYVNETFARRLTRFSLLSDGCLENQQTIAEFGAGTYPDGLALAVDGSLWITSIISNRVLVVRPDRSVSVVLEDSRVEQVATAESAFLAHKLGRNHVDQARGQRLNNISNLAFGGDDLKTAYLGNLSGDNIPYFTSPVAGVSLPHWEAPIGAWLSVLSH